MSVLKISVPTEATIKDYVSVETHQVCSSGKTPARVLFVVDLQQREWLNVLNTVAIDMLHVKPRTR